MERRKNVLNGDFRFQLFSVIFDEEIAFSSTLCRILIASNHVKNTWKTHQIGLHSMNYVFFLMSRAFSQQSKHFFNEKIDTQTKVYYMSIREQR